MNRIIQRSQGNALLITLLVMLVAVALVGMVMRETATVAKNTNRSRQYQAAQAAAAGAVDYAYAVWLKRTSTTHNLLLSGTSLAVTAPSFSGSNAPPGTPGFVYTTGTGLNDGTLKIEALDKYGVPITTSGTTPAVIVGPVPGYTGWWGRTYTYAATARLKVDNGDPDAPSAGARRLFHYTEVPLFQCMFFFQDDLEIYNPAEMIISGLIHTNRNLYLSTKTKSSNLKIQGQASYAAPYIYSATEPPTVTGTPAEVNSTDYPPTWTNSQAKQLHQVAPMAPMGTALDDLFKDTTYNNNPNVAGTYHELIEVPDPSHTDPIETDADNPRRVYNIAAKKGGLIVHVTGTNIVGASSNSGSNVDASSIALTTIGSNGLPVAVQGKTVLIAAGNGATLPAAGTTAYNNAVYAFSQSLSKQPYNAAIKFYDDRENTYMNVVNVDIGLLNTAISNSVTGLFNNVVYIYDDSTSTNPNVVRLKNGATISNEDGLTIGSMNPVYIQGDYNTGGTGTYKTDVPSNVSNANNDQHNYKSGYTTKPAAIIADGITLLSNNWSDSNSASSLSNRDAKNTTYNVALLGGYLSSDSISSSYYSGGAINYPRFLEGWGDFYCTYFGSMVELFPSNTKNPWIMPGKTGEYYGAPKRRFNFDTRYSSKSPPGSTNAVVLSRGIWSKW